MGEVEFSLQGLSKQYDPGLFKKKVPSVKDLSIDIVRGEVFGLIGPNGAGKSSTIRLMLGLIRPDAGAVYFRDKPLEESRFRNFIGYLPENPYLYDHLTLDELLDFGLAFSGQRDEKKPVREDLLRKTGMEYARNRSLKTFSKGMLQRAGLCFALVRDPDVVILDEPMSGLDPLGRKMVIDLILELKSQGKTIFFCSHILNDVERLCDRIGIMAAGRLLDVTTRKRLREEVGDESGALEKFFLQIVLEQKS